MKSPCLATRLTLRNVRSWRTAEVAWGSVDFRIGPFADLAIT